MKIAITADVHLRSRENSQERYNALENILTQLREDRIEHLIIAGDLFDENYQNYAEFESLCRSFADVHLYVIPGNHDKDLNEKCIIGENLSIYSEPTIQQIGGTVFLFLPYRELTSMGELIAEKRDLINGKNWVLIGHGDYCCGVRAANPLEPGTYMPLARSDVEQFRPRNVFLGHIHKASCYRNVHYVGSPCGLHISETGKRRFIIYDSDTTAIESRNIDSDVLYFDEHFVVVPIENETEIISREIRKRIAAWGVVESDLQKVRVRVKVSGYTANRPALQGAIREAFNGLKFYQEKIDLDGLSLSPESPQLSAIAEETRALVENLDWPTDDAEPSKQDIL